MPEKSTKHITNPQDPLGWMKDGKVKTQDGDTGKIVWRGVRRGILRDFDGDITSQVHNKENAKITNTHSPRMGAKRKRTPESRG